MNKQFLKDALGWGFLLWLIGYILGIVLFFAVPPTLLGWVIAPIGAAIIVWVLFAKIKGTTVSYYVKLALVWTILAIVLDYLFIVQFFNPEDGYYKSDVYFYYAVTLILPLAVGWWKVRRSS